MTHVHSPLRRPGENGGLVRHPLGLKSLVKDVANGAVFCDSVLLRPFYEDQSARDQSDSKSGRKSTTKSILT